MSTQVELSDVTKALGGTEVLRGLTFRLGPGQFLSLLGPSGCGKTTTLRLIAGLLFPDRGRVEIGGEDVTHLPPTVRNLGLVFQNYALWPHMTVLQNVAFGLEIRRVPAAEVGARVREALRLVRLEGLEGRYPGQLSGGQQQRVALARAIVVEPRVLLLDEPLSNLDRKLRLEMQVELKRLQETLNLTTIYVTHDQEEALSMSDVVLVMNHGSIEQEGTPREIYESPASRFVASFIGSANFLEAQVAGIGPDGRITCRTTDGQDVSAHAFTPFRQGEAVTLIVRPERVRLFAAAGEDRGESGEVEYATYVGSKVRYILRLGGGARLSAETDGEAQPFSRGDRVRVEFSATALKG